MCDRDRAFADAHVQNELDLEEPVPESYCGRLLCSILWLCLLVYVAWPVASALGSLWVFLQVRLHFVALVIAARVVWTLLGNVSHRHFLSRGLGHSLLKRSVMPIPS